MKKTIIILSVVLCILANSLSIFAVGNIEGEILNTDIKAYIDGNPIKSYNIEGWTGIVAEDLMDYGFEVIWDSQARTLEVNKSVRAVETTPAYQFENNDKPVGSHAGYVFSTDIKTYVNGVEVTSFNIGGYTVIYIDELVAFGNVVWDADRREISYTYSEPWQISLIPANEDKAEHSGNDGITYISGYFKRGVDKFDISGENLDHIARIALEHNKRYGGLRLTVSMTANHLLNDTGFVNLCSEMVTISYDGTRIRDNADVANTRASITVNGVPLKIKEVVMEKGNNNATYCFVLDLDIAKEDITEISFEIK